MKLQTYHAVAAVRVSWGGVKKIKSEALQTFLLPHLRWGKLSLITLFPFIFKWEYITDYYCTQSPVRPTQVLFVLSKSVMFQFCFSFVIYLRWFLCFHCWRWCHWYPSLDIALYQLIVIWQLLSVCHQPLPCNASACYPAIWYVMYNTYHSPISSVIACLTHPQRWESCITYIPSIHQLLSKSNAECDNVLFIHCKLPIKVLPSICSALGIKYSVKQFSVFELNPRILKYTLIPVVVGLNNECRHDQRGGSGDDPQQWLEICFWDRQ